MDTTTHRQRPLVRACRLLKISCVLESTTNDIHDCAQTRTEARGIEPDHQLKGTTQATTSHTKGTSPPSIFSHSPQHLERAAQAHLNTTKSHPRSDERTRGQAKPDHHGTCGDQSAVQRVDNSECASVT